MTIVCLRDQRRAMRRWRRAAFSLIELLVSIAIIAILLSLLLPTLAGARAAGRSAACLANLRTMGQAITLYANTHQERFPISSHTTGSLVAPSSWLQSLEDFGFIKPARLCKADEFRSGKLTSYATNEHFEPLTPGLDYNPITKKPLPGGRARPYDRHSLVTRPWATIYAFEPAGEGTTDHLNTHQFKDAMQVGAALAVKRHTGASNVVFVDGHARSIPWTHIRDTYAPSTSPFDPETAP